MIVDVGTEPDIDTVCAIPSMTKSLAVCAALIDRDRGLVDLDAPVTRYLPEHPTDGSDEADPPTPRMLSSMRGVLTDDSAWVDPLVDFTAAELFSQLAGGVRYSRTPGTEYEYSNLGFGLAGLAVGRPIEDLIFSGICGPLGLSQTWFDGVVPDLATWTRTVRYPLDPDGRRATCPFAPTGEAQAAAGGMLSTVRDLSTWISSLGAAFRPPHRGEPQTLSRASCREVQRRHQIDLPSLNTVPTGGLHVAVSGYAPGLVAAYDLRRGMVISHARGLPGYKLFMCRRPDSGTGIVCLTNSHRGDPVELTKSALMLTLHFNDVPAQTIGLWPETIELRRQPESLIREWDIGLAEEIFFRNVDLDRPSRSAAWRSRRWQRPSAHFSRAVRTLTSSRHRRRPTSRGAFAGSGVSRCASSI